MTRLATAAGLLLLAGCVSAPVRREVDLDVALPASWAAPTADGEIAGRWWESFDHPGLTALVELAVERNRDLRAAAARLDRAAAEARIAGAALTPTVDLALSSTRQRQNFIGFPIPGGTDGVLSTTSTRHGLGAELSWEADLWGRVRAGARGAVAELQASGADLRGARLSVAARAARLGFAILEARQQLDLALRSAESFRESAEQVRARFERGLRPALDLRLARSTQAGAEALVELRRRRLDGLERQLDVLVGRYPDRATAALLIGRALPAPPPAVPGGLPAELLARRPDLVAAERRVAAADARRQEARRALLPRLSLTASGGTASDQLADLLDGDFRVWSLIGGLTQPLFHGGRLRAGVARAEALRREALESYAARALSAFAEVESALAAAQRLAAQQQRLDESARQLLAAVELAEERYRSGVGIYLAVLESRTRALAAESEAIAVRLQRLDVRVDLHLALGGGFEPEVGDEGNP